MIDFGPAFQLGFIQLYSLLIVSAKPGMRLESDNVCLAHTIVDILTPLVIQKIISRKWTILSQTLQTKEGGSQQQQLILFNSNTWRDTWQLSRTLNTYFITHTVLCWRWWMWSLSVSSLNCCKEAWGVRNSSGVCGAVLWLGWVEHWTLLWCRPRR